VSYAELAGYIARLNHLKKDQEKLLAYHEWKAQKAIDATDYEAARQAGALVVEYREKVRDTAEKINSLVAQRQQIAADVQVLDARIGGMLADEAAHAARMGVINTKVVLSDTALNWEATKAKADAAEEMAGLSIHDEVIQDEDYEKSKSKDAIDHYLSSLKPKKKP
jgi:hypothetical protein